MQNSNSIITIIVLALAVRPTSELELEWIAAQFDVFRLAGFRLMQGDGRHGSSWLRPDPASPVEGPRLSAVLEFIDSALHRDQAPK